MPTYSCKTADKTYPADTWLLLHNQPFQPAPADMSLQYPCKTSARFKMNLQMTYPKHVTETQKTTDKYFFISGLSELSFTAMHSRIIWIPTDFNIFQDHKLSFTMKQLFTTIHSRTISSCIHVNSVQNHLYSKHN